MIRLRNIWYRYPRMDNWCLKGITAEIYPGLNILIGPNGSGKTTLLRIIAGFYKPQRGRVEIFGKAIRSYTDVLGKLIYMPSNPKVFTIGPTVRRDIERIIETFNSPYTVDEILEMFSLKELGDRKIFHLSEGEHRLLAIASSIASDAKIILMDEPTVGLDKIYRETLVKALNRAKKEKVIIIATNDLRLASRGDNLFLLNDGKLVLSGSPKLAMYSEEFSELFGFTEIVEFCKRVGLRDIVTPEELAHQLINLVRRNV